MKKKSPIDEIRQSSGYSNVGTNDDGAIMKMINIGDRLLIVKERSIYETVFADKIDPDRTNINLPNTINRLLIDQGSDSELVARTLLTAITIFKSEYLKDNIDCNMIIFLCLGLLSELIVLEKEIDTYLDVEDQVSVEYEKRRFESKGYQIPSIVNIESRCKTIFQKADHIEQTLMEIITHFYPKDRLTKQSHFPKFKEVLNENMVKIQVLSNL